MFSALKAQRKRRIRICCRTLKAPLFQVILWTSIVRSAGSLFKEKVLPKFFTYDESMTDEELKSFAVWAAVIRGIAGSLGCFLGGRIADRWASGEWQLFKRGGDVRYMPLTVVLGTLCALPLLAMGYFFTANVIVLPALVFESLFSECW